METYDSTKSERYSQALAHSLAPSPASAVRLATPRASISLVQEHPLRYIRPMSTSPPRPNSGLCPADIQPGEPYELSDGHAVYCAPSGGRHALGNVVGALPLATEPAVESAAMDAGFAPDERTLRAPDISVGNIPNEPGWVKGAPALAVEYADLGQDERDLAAKISELLRAGSKMVWVVRLAGPRRVEVHEAGKPVRTCVHGETIDAPGILSRPMPVEALYDRNAAFEVTLRNLLTRKGYDSLDEVRKEGEAKGREEGEAKGREEGEAKGREEGEAKGHAAGLRDAALRLIASGMSPAQAGALLGIDPQELLR